MNTYTFLKRRWSLIIEVLEDRTVPVILEFDPAPTFGGQTTVSVDGETGEPVEQWATYRTSLQARNVQLASVQTSSANVVTQVTTMQRADFAIPNRDPQGRFWTANIWQDLRLGRPHPASVEITNGTVSADGQTDYGAPFVLRILPESHRGEQEGDPVIITISAGVNIAMAAGGESSPGTMGTSEFRGFADVGDKQGYREIFNTTIDAQDLIQGRAGDKREHFVIEGKIGQTIRIGGLTEHRWQSNGIDPYQNRNVARLVLGVEVAPPPDLEAIAVEWNTERQPTPTHFDRRGFDFTYTIDRPIRTQATEVAFFWARGPQFEDRISEARDPIAGIIRGPIPVNTPAGTYTFNNPARWEKPPTGTTHILVVLDPENRLAESNEKNNVVALRLHSPSEILTGSVTFVGNGPTMTGSFIPGKAHTGKALTLSEAEVALGVDHFNWVQLITAEPSGTYFERIRDQLRIELPTYDPPLRGPNGLVNANANELQFVIPHLSGTSQFADNLVDEFFPYYNEIDVSGKDSGVPTYSFFTDPFQLRFEDTPQAPPGTYRNPADPRDSSSFMTTLWGVDRNHNIVPLPMRITRLWRTNHDGVSGGVFDLRGVDIRSGAEFVVGPDSGTSPTIRLLSPEGAELFSVQPFESTFTGGVRTAIGDLTGNGMNDVVAVAGPGRAPTVVIYDGFSGQELRRFDAFESSFQGGLFVTMADFNGDGIADVVVSPDQGGGPRVRVFDGRSFEVIADFFGIQDSNFRGGVRIGTGDINGDGVPDLIVGAGFGGGPRLALFDGKTLIDNDPIKLMGDFFVFEPTLRNGVFVAAGDLTSDGIADLIVGAGPGGGPRVFALAGRDLLEGLRTPVANFFAGDPNGRDGIRIAARDLDGDGRVELIAASGPNVEPRVTTYNGREITPDDTPAPMTDFLVFDASFRGGLFVA